MNSYEYSKNIAYGEKNIVYGEKKMTSIYADNHKFEKSKIVTLTGLLFVVSVNTVLFLLSATKVFYPCAILFLATTELIFGTLTLTVFLLLRDDLFE